MNLGKKPRRNPSKSAPVVEKFNFSIGFYPQEVFIIRVWALEPNSELSQQSTLTVVVNGNLNGNLNGNQNRSLNGNLDGTLNGN